MKNKTIAVIGCGNMGSAIVRGLTKVYVASHVLVYDHAEVKVQALAAELGVRAVSTIAEALSHADVVLIAVKPKTVLGLLAEVRVLLQGLEQKPLFISIAAGIRVPQMEAALGNCYSVVRVMPNLPCTVGCGISGVFGADSEGVAEARRIFETVGAVVQVNDEAQIDAVTALSACGPGFMFRLLEALTEGGVKIGLSPENSELLAKHMLYGSGALAVARQVPPAILRQEVATPGGTTLAGLAVLEEKGVPEAFVSALVASVRRAQEMAAEQNKVA